MSVLYASFAVMSAFNALSLKETTIQILRMNESFFASQTNIILNTSLALFTARIADSLLLMLIKPIVTITTVMYTINSLVAK
jgi:hypothetical protein